MSKAQTLNATLARTENTRNAMIERLKEQYNVLSIDDVLLILSSGMSKVAEQMHDEETELDNADLCKLQHCLVQSSTAISKLKEVGELEARLSQLENNNEFKN